MRETSRRMALCGVLTALAMVMLLLGGLLPMATFCAPILAMVVLLPVLPEFGSRWAWAAYGATALLALLLVPDRELALVYVFFGCYPILRPYLERIPTRPLRLAAKLLICNVTMAALYAVVLFVFQLEAVAAEFSTFSVGFLAVLLLLANLDFVVLDIVIGRLTLLWKTKLRKKLLKA